MSSSGISSSVNDVGKKMVWNCSGSGGRGGSDTDDGVFYPFPKISEHFPKIFQNCSEGQTNVSEHFPKVSEDFQGLPKTFEQEPKMFRSYTNEFKYKLGDKLDISEIIDIFTNED